MIGKCVALEMDWHFYIQGSVKKWMHFDSGIEIEKFASYCPAEERVWIQQGNSARSQRMHLSFGRIKARSQQKNISEIKKIGPHLWAEQLLDGIRVCVCDFQRVRTVKTEIRKHFSRCFPPPFYSSFPFVHRSSLHSTHSRDVSSVTTKYNAFYLNWFLHRECTLAMNAASSSLVRLLCVRILSLHVFGAKYRNYSQQMTFQCFSQFSCLPTANATIATILLSTTAQNRHPAEAVTHIYRLGKLLKNRQRKLMARRGNIPGKDFIRISMPHQR